jgi:hypothetical protein
MFLVVAGQQAFLADSPDEAWALADAAHPNDLGAFALYLRPPLVPNTSEKQTGRRQLSKANGGRSDPNGG